MPLLDAFDTLIAANAGMPRALRRTLVAMREALRSGRSLSEAMRVHPSWFDAAEVAIVEAAQVAGTLPESLRMPGEDGAYGPLYCGFWGIIIAGLFAWILGFGATLAEPALNALGATVQNMTNGSFKKSMLMYSVAFGVATGILLGVTKLIFNFNLLYILVPGYVLAVILTTMS